MDSNQNQLINRLDNTLDRHLDTADEHTMDIVIGKHPLMTEKMKALRMENEALKEKLQKYVEQDYVMKTAKNSNLMWPKNMPVFHEVQKVRGTRAKLEILHEGLVPQRKGYDYLDWLTKRINSAVDNAECDRWLLNHVAYFSERKFAKMTVGMDVRCEHCNQFFLAKSMKKHSKRCPGRVFYVWNEAGYTVPTHTDTNGNTLYVCIICGERDPSKPKIVTHLARHDFAHLQRFNLDAIMAHSPEFAVEQHELRFFTRKSCKFSAHSFYTEG